MKPPPRITAGRDRDMVTLKVNGALMVFSPRIAYRLAEDLHRHADYALLWQREHPEGDDVA